MKLGVNELCDRYEIKSRKSLYSRTNALGITLDKDGNKSVARDEQVKLLDQQNEHLKNGGTLKNFVPTAIAQVTVDNTDQNQDTTSADWSPPTSQSEGDSLQRIGTTQHTPQLNTQSEAMTILLGDMANKVAMAIAEKMTPPNPTWYLTELERIRAIGVAVPTSEIKALIGTKPRLEKGKETFERGSYTYIPDGKIGRERAWKVFRKTDNQVEYKVSD